MKHIRAKKFNNTLYGISTKFTYLPYSELAVPISYIDSNGIKLAVGQVYTYRRDDINDPWIEVSKLPSEFIDVDKYFGTTLDLSHDGLTLTIGLGSKEYFYTELGQNIVYKRKSRLDAWVKDTFLAPTVVDKTYYNSPLLSKNKKVAIACTPTFDANGIQGSGKVTTFIKDQETESFIDIGDLTASDAAEYDNFGSAASISGDGLVLVVSADLKIIKE